MKHAMVRFIKFIALGMMFPVFMSVLSNAAYAVQGSGSFSVTLNTGAGSGTYRFSFAISGIGAFRVDCGTGGTLSTSGTQSGTITKNTSAVTNVRCSYTKSTTNRTVTFIGSQTNVTAYDASLPVLRFTTPTTIVGFSGSIGRVFPTIDGGLTNGMPDATKQPSFEKMFTSASDTYASGMTGTIPSDFFAGVTGLARSNMFNGTFAGCSSLTGGIPAGLFSGITGIAPGATDVFKETFLRATGLGTNTYIAPQLFSGLYTTDAATVVSNMTDIFTETQLLTSCPSGTTLFTTGFESAWNGKVSCNDGSYWIPRFSVTTTTQASGFDFGWNLAARGTFYVNCGDENAILVYPDNSTSSGGGTISRTTTTPETYICRYSSGGSKTIQFGGAATGYNTTYNISTGPTSGTLLGMNFVPGAQYVKSMSGALGQMFPSVGITPNFFMFCYGCSNLIEIPETLFYGIHGQSYATFKSAFYGATSLTSIPVNLFRDAVNPTLGMFAYTFANCSGLTQIPGKLFSNISDGANYMFEGTFQNCDNLTSIPGDLFNQVDNAYSQIFNRTFYDCNGITTIPDGLFYNVSGAAQNAFRETFYGCTGLTGAIPDNLFYKISGVAANMFVSTFRGCVNLGTENGASKYYIPTNLFRGVTGIQPNMFSDTFFDTGLLRCCPVGMRRITSDDSATYNIADYVSYFSGRVSCVSGTPAESEETLVNGVCTANCGKTLKTSMGHEFPLYASKVTPRAIGIKSQGLNNGETCYAPLKSGVGNLNMNDGALIYHVATASELSE